MIVWDAPKLDVHILVLLSLDGHGRDIMVPQGVLHLKTTNNSDVNLKITLYF